MTAVAEAVRAPRHIGRWVRPDWKRVVIVASGPSFKLNDYEQARAIAYARHRDACRIIVVNDNWRWMRCADILYAGDGSWWDSYAADVIQSSFAGEMWTQDADRAIRYGLHFVRQKRADGLTTTPGLIHGGGNGGHQAIQLAYLLGAHEIALVGLDMQADPDEGRIDEKGNWRGMQHHFGEHPVSKKYPRVHQLPFHLWIPRLEEMAPGLTHAGVRVFNCSPRSAVQCFPREPLNYLLSRWIDET